MLKREGTWRRFELTTDDPAQKEELDKLLDRLNLSRRELALIVMSLRVRSGFTLEDFGHADPWGLLSRAQFEQVMLAIQYSTPIIIDGDRTKPTGKTTLCDYLRSQGAVAYEAWELEEMEKKPGHNGPENSVHLTIQLNRLLSIFQNKENAD